MSGSINEAEGLRPQRDPSAFRLWRARLVPLLIAVVTFAAIRPALDAVGERTDSADAPGLTLDEIFNIQTGVYLWRNLVLEGPAYFTPGGADRVFNQPQANPDHPPLGRLAIGAAHDLLTLVPNDPLRAPPYSVRGARHASALLFAITVWLVGNYATRWYGVRAGVMAAVSLTLMPRAFGHAHLASLETAIGLTFTWTVLYVADRWSQDIANHRPGWRGGVIAGLLLGLALLTKIQAILLPIPIGLWALWHWRWRAIPALLVFGLVGVAVFFLGWPWLWLDPIAHALQYLGRATERPTLYCYYLGERYADLDVPWHYSFAMFLVTVPAGLQALGLWGVGRMMSSSWRTRPGAPSDLDCPEVGDNRRRGDPRARLVAGVVLFVLTFFALPGITVYDGERLFLVVFPLWAVLIGFGVQTCQVSLSSARRRSPDVAVARTAGLPPSEATTDIVHTDHGSVETCSPGEVRGRGTRAQLAASGCPIVVALLLLAGIGEGLWGLIQFEACHLSYYNLAVGGLSGANRLGFEPTYWRDSFTLGFLDKVAATVPAGSTLYIAPVLHPANRIDLALLSPILQQRGLQTDSYDDQDPAKRNMRYVLVFRRHADPWASLEPVPEGGRLLCEVRRDGVQLAACYDLRPK